jgi:hypothetical protein
MSIYFTLSCRNIYNAMKNNSNIYWLEYCVVDRRLDRFLIRNGVVEWLLNSGSSSTNKGRK